MANASLLCMTYVDDTDFLCFHAGFIYLFPHKIL